MKVRIQKILIIFLGVSSIVLSGCGGGGGGGSDSTSNTDPVVSVPQEFTAVYDELSEQLSTRESELRADWDGTRTPVTFATSLLTASSNNGAALLSPAWQDGIRLYLQAIADLGVRAVIIQINYPILTPGFTVDALSYLAAYTEIADDVRALGLKVIIEHNALIPGFSELNPLLYYAGLTKDRFSMESYEEVRAIVEQLKPDYISLVSEPQTVGAATGLQMSVSDWSAYVEGVVNQLAVDVPGHAVKLGAGSGTWENPGLVTAFAAINGLDYIDIHAYPLTNNISNYLKNLETWPLQIRAINPSLEIISSESWLYKAKADELGAAIDPELLVRDVYSFWEPLDIQFLDVLTITAYKSNYSIVAPFWSNYFFAYLDYNDPSLTGLTIFELYDEAYSAASQNLLVGQTTELGRAFSQLIAP